MYLFYPMCRGCNKCHNVCWFYRVTFLSCCYSVTMLDNFSTRNKEEEVTKKNLDLGIFSPKGWSIFEFLVISLSLSFFSRNSKLSKLSSISVTQHKRFIRPKNRKKGVYLRQNTGWAADYIHAILQGWQIWFMDRLGCQRNHTRSYSTALPFWITC